MFRLVAVVLLTLTQLAGPLACCCATWRPATAPSSASRQADPGPAKKSCCAHHERQETNRETPAAPRPADRSECPCKADGSARTAVLSGGPETIQHQSGQLLPALDVVSTVITTTLHTASCTQPPSELLPFVTADDLLRAHHVLRC
jgi:hypothetical protein